MWAIGRPARRMPCQHAQRAPCLRPLPARPLPAASQRTWLMKPDSVLASLRSLITSTICSGWVEEGVGRGVG